MSFIASGSEQTEDNLENNPFWGDLKLSDFRESMRVDSVVTPARARYALLSAVLEANSRLVDWEETQREAGYETVGDVPARPEHPEGAYKHLYLKAVWSLAKASLIERYRDYDTTHSGHTNAEDLNPVADDYRRDAAWAINDIRGIHRVTVELI